MDPQLDDLGYDRSIFLPCLHRMTMEASMYYQYIHFWSLSFLFWTGTLTSKATVPRGTC